MMIEQLEKQILSRLKKQLCDQNNVELIIFNQPNAKKVGLMCSECFVDQQLIASLKPIEKFCIPIKKYLRILITFYKEYCKSKQSDNWAPTTITKENDVLRKKIQSFYNDGLKNALEIVQYVDSCTKKATQDLRKVYQDADFDKLVDFLNEQNEQEQQRIILTNELTRVCNNIKIVEGKHKYSTEQKLKKQAEEIIIAYKQKIRTAILGLTEFVEIHKQCLRSTLQ